jgi:aminopeptidase N
MRSTRTWIPAAVLAIASAAPAHAIDPFFPEFGNNGIDVRNYAIDLDVDPVRNELDGRAVLTVRALNRLSSFTLDLRGLDVASVRLDGITAGFEQSDGKLRIRPRTPVQKNAVFKLSVAYGGEPEPIDDPTFNPPSSEYQLGWTPWRGTTYVVSEPVGASTWYPVNDEPTDKASYRIGVTVPKPLTAVANGLLLSVTDLGNRRRFLWEQAEPMASYLAITDVNRFEVDRQTGPGGIPIRHHLTEKTPDEAIAAYRKTPQMMAFLTPLIGPYPFRSYGSVLIGDPSLYYALETQSMSTFPDGPMDEETIMHELVHQWFGDSVTVERWRDLWLAEGFATYFEYLWRYRRDPAGFDALMGRMYDYIVSEGVGPAVVSRPEDIFADTTYYRGALTLYALRQTVGDKLYFRTLRTYYARHRNGNASSQDFIDVAVDVTGRPGVRNLLNDWLYDEKIPPLPGREGRAVAAKGKVEAPELGKAVRRHH